MENAPPKRARRVRHFQREQCPSPEDATGPGTFNTNAPASLSSNMEASTYTSLSHTFHNLNLNLDQHTPSDDMVVDSPSGASTPSTLVDGNCAANNATLPKLSIKQEKRQQRRQRALDAWLDGLPQRGGRETFRRVKDKRIGKASKAKSKARRKKAAKTRSGETIAQQVKGVSDVKNSGNGGIDSSMGKQKAERNNSRSRRRRRRKKPDLMDL